MALRVYKPRNIAKVQAELVTLENVNELCKTFGGRLIYTDEQQTAIAGFKVATFDGVKNFHLDHFIVKDEDGELSEAKIDDFNSKYELARVTATRS